VRALVTALSLVALSCSRPANHRIHVIDLPAGTMELHQPIVVAAATELRGARRGTNLRMADNFRGEAAIVIEGNDVWLHDFSIDGNRAALEIRQGLPPYDRTFASFTENNGIGAVSRDTLDIDNLHIRNIAGFAILASRVAHLNVKRLTVEDSGSRNAKGRNNATGGILIEEGSTDFDVEYCTFRNILGNALWTHSLYTSPRNQRGVFARNRFDTVGRDAIQVGHAKDMTVADNFASSIGFPVEASDLEARAIPVGIDTAGNVEDARYIENRIAEINGKCMDLDGLHDSEIRGNVCVNHNPPAAYPLGNYGIVMNDTNPDMRTRNIHIVGNRIERPVFGAIFVIGERNLIARNQLLDLNTAHCNQNIAHYQCNYAAADPRILEAGIYLGRGAERPAPARGNVIENNFITGWGMKTGCVVSAPDIPNNWNIVRGNDCH
jgi:hypothetical protein